MTEPMVHATPERQALCVLAVATVGNGGMRTADYTRRLAHAVPDPTATFIALRQAGLAAAVVVSEGHWLFATAFGRAIAALHPLPAPADHPAVVA